MCERAGIISLTESELAETTALITQLCQDYTVEVGQETNPAKLLAFSMFTKQLVLIAPDFLEGAIHVATNQSNENGKTFTSTLSCPRWTTTYSRLSVSSSPPWLSFCRFLQSHLANQTTSCMTLSQQVFEDHDIETMKITLEGNTKLAQIFELITLMSFATFYQCLLEEVNPSPIPVVESFKELLKRASNSVERCPLLMVW